MKYSISPESYLTFSNLIIVFPFKSSKNHFQNNLKTLSFLWRVCWWCVCFCRCCCFVFSTFFLLFSALMLFVEHFPLQITFLVIRSYRQLEKHKIHFYFHLKTLSFLWRDIYGVVDLVVCVMLFFLSLLFLSLCCL